MDNEKKKELADLLLLVRSKIFSESSVVTSVETRDLAKRKYLDADERIWYALTELKEARIEIERLRAELAEVKSAPTQDQRLLVVMQEFVAELSKNNYCPAMCDPTPERKYIAKELQRRLDEHYAGPAVWEKQVINGMEVQVCDLNNVRIIEMKPRKP